MTAESRWTILRITRVAPKSGTYVLARCTCGTERELLRSRVTTGSSRSCGYLQREVAAQMNTTHGMSKTPEWKAWLAMIQRCTSPTNQSWDYYGGRGITVCPEWLSDFTVFWRDMGPRPKGRSLDRIDVNGNYEPSNCRWATLDEQQRNKRKRVKCAKGHGFTPENTSIRTLPNGETRRVCRECARVASRRYRERLLVAAATEAEAVA